MVISVSLSSLSEPLRRALAVVVLAERAPRGVIFPIVGIKLFGNERRMKKPELRRRYVWLPVANVHGGAGGRVGVDLAPSNPAGSIPRHPMARRAKALPVIRADPNTRDLFLLSTEEASFVRSFRGCHPRETDRCNCRIRSIESSRFPPPRASGSRNFFLLPGDE